ncbi:hypothetical protein KUV57_22835 [Epibacterium sp. DP7N7-1]|nr:hypothetical protein [Epibacterium sp. DP7N7-1]
MAFLHNCTHGLTAQVLLSSCIASTAVAQDTPIELQEILVSADRAGGRTLDIATNISVIDEEKIEDRDINDLEDLLRNEAGRRATEGRVRISSFLRGHPAVTHVGELVVVGPEPLRGNLLYLA